MELGLQGGNQATRLGRHQHADSEQVELADGGEVNEPAPRMGRSLPPTTAPNRTSPLRTLPDGAVTPLNAGPARQIPGGPGAVRGAGYCSAFFAASGTRAAWRCEPSV